MEISDWEKYRNWVDENSEKIKELRESTCLMENPDAKPDEVMCAYLLGKLSNRSLVYERFLREFEACAKCYENAWGHLPPLVELEIERASTHFNYQTRRKG